jgi:UMF1 family MFS transporter
MGGSSGLLQRLALHRPELRAWAMYDWANSAMMTVIVTAVFPIFFAKVAYQETEGMTAAEVHGWTTTAALAIIAILAPLLGIVADRAACKKKLLLGFALMGAAACVGMFFIQPGEWEFAAAMFLLANIGASGSFVFYDALLPHVASRDEVDQLSTSAFALGYLGGGLLLAISLAMIQSPATFGLPSGEDLTPMQASLPVRLSFLAVALWWLAFSWPLLRRVPEPPLTQPSARQATGMTLLSALGAWRQTLRDLLRYRQAALFLLAFLIYNDGILTIIRMASIYGEELKLDTGQLMLALLMVQFVGVPCTFLFGWVARRVGAKRSVLLGLGVYTMVVFMAYNLETTRDFFIMAGSIALVQGGTQALSRSLFASMIPVEKSGEFFGLFAVFDRFAGILGPLLFVQVLSFTGDVRQAVLPLLVFFVVGAGLLCLVRVEEGRADSLS